MSRKRAGQPGYKKIRRKDGSSDWAPINAAQRLKGKIDRYDPSEFNNNSTIEYIDDTDFDDDIEDIDFEDEEIDYSDIDETFTANKPQELQIAQNYMNSLHGNIQKAHNDLSTGKLDEKTEIAVAKYGMESMRESLIDSRHEDTRRVVAEHAGEDILDKLKNDPSAAVRGAVVSNPNVNPNTIVDMMDDSSYFVQLQLARKAPVEFIYRKYNQTNDPVMREVIYDRVKDFLDNSSLNKETKRHISRETGIPFDKK